MMSLSTIVVPVLLDTDTKSIQLARQWAHLYHYGGLYMPAMSVAATSLYVSVALRKCVSARKQRLLYTTAGMATITIVPFTLLMMVPINSALLRLEVLASAAASVPDLSVVQELVVRWAWLHAVRSAFPLVGAVLGLLGVLRELGL